MNKQTIALKKRIYVVSFAFLGTLMALVVYGLGSLIVLKKGIALNETAYLWILLVGGCMAGIMEGQRWWDIIYVRKAHLHWNKHILEAKLLGLTLLIILTIVIIFLYRYSA
ncbi:MAG TPA: hypothetical protein VFX17_01810 [Patescibacteria group bacterium]|nr:hypothetical protein [Patescibacteria group bacterium]